MNEPGESLRYRKKRRTRAALERATLRLAAEKGYDHVTVEEIAAEADVSVRTFFNYFAGKDDALIGTDPEAGPRMAARVHDAPAGISPFDAFRTSVLAEIDDELNNARDLWLLRKEVLMQRPDLLVRAFTSSAASEQLLAEAVAHRAGLPESHVYPRLLVAAGTAAFRCAVTRWAQDDTTALGDLVAEAFDLFGTGLAHAPHHDKPHNSMGGS
ncbi:TetR/AcrR family transcriptional regulator [Lentzea sp. NPDC051213]|uniref:TetR/AcrR family transcriptional regulator n=1 Tax=Lentzea sp. NPDC051213 TaxID=3364126 RepID=UPI0037A06D68